MADKIPKDLVPVSADHGKDPLADIAARYGGAGASPAPAASSSSSMDSLASRYGGGTQLIAAKPAEPGSSPSEALPHSPLNPIERAAFGWIAKPDQKLDFLTQHYGKENVALVHRESDDKKSALTFAVKDADGAWKQIDPNGLTDMAAAAVVPQMFGGKAGFGDVKKIWNQLTMKDVLGGAAQDVGKFGVKSLAATAAGASAAAALSPTGPVGMVIGAAAAGGMAAMGEGGLEQLVQAGATKLNPALNIGPSNAKDFTAQASADFIMGAMQEGTGQAVGLALKGGAKGFGAVLKRLTNTPEGRDAAATILTGMGHDAATARIRTENPMGVAEFDKMASADRINNTDTLGARMKAAVGSFMDSAQAARKALGRQYDPLQREAAKATFDVSPDLLQSFDVLKERAYVDAAGNPAIGGGLERSVTGANREALDTVLKIKSDLLERVQAGKQLKFGELDTAINNLDNHLYGQNMVNDKTLGASLTQIQVALKNARSEGLQSFNPSVAQGIAALDKTYGPVKNLLQELGDKAQPGRVDAFMKQVVRDDGSFNSELMNSIKALLPGTENPTQTILEMHTARKTAQGGALIWNPMKGAMLPKSPKLAAAAATAYSKVANSFIGDEASSGAQFQPYLKKAIEQFRSMNPETRAAIATSADALKAIQGMVIAAPQQEAAQKQQMLIQSGALTPQAAQKMGMGVGGGQPQQSSGGPGLGAGGQPPQIPSMAPTGATNPGFSGEGQ